MKGETGNSVSADAAVKMFSGRKALIASMHGKDVVIGPVLEAYLAVESFTEPSLDTDQFGTFTGEVERPGDPVSTLKKKILTALKISGHTLGIGNEGSFGPHPSIPFVASDHEVVMLIDLANNLQLHASQISTETNYNARTITTVRELIDFADEARFPSHGIILRQMKDGRTTAMRKGILSWESLHAAFLGFACPGAEVLAETDMRALYNPSRMNVIGEATQRLMEKLLKTCPSCHWPGFDVSRTEGGLPCQYCASATRQTLLHVSECTKCGFIKEEYYPVTRHADPMFCDHCNP